MTEPRHVFNSIQHDQWELLFFFSPPLPVLRSQPSAVPPMMPRPVRCNSDIIDGQRAGSDDVQDGFRREAPDFPSAEREPRWEHPPSHSVCQEEHEFHFDVRSSGGQVERDGIPSSEFGGPGYRGRRNGRVGSEPESKDDMFGSMAPCWRLLERAKGYMDKVCTLLTTFEVSGKHPQIKVLDFFIEGVTCWISSEGMEKLGSGRLPLTHLITPQR